MTFVRILLALAALLLPHAASAEPGASDKGASDWAKSESAAVRLLAASTAAGETGRLRLGLQFKLEPGWKIYWRTPGDAGFPPKLDWSGSQGLKGTTVLWPAPHRFVLAGLQNYGYVGDVVLPIDAEVERGAVGLRLAVDFLACAQICVPQQASLALNLPAGPGQPSAVAHDIGRFAALVPDDGARAGLTLERAETAGEGDAAVLVLKLKSTADAFDRPDAFIESDDSVAFDQPKVTVAGATAEIVVPVAKGAFKGSLAGKPLTVTVVDGIRAMEAKVTPTPGAVSAPAGASLAAMLAVALLGGLILNLMPCVLPVLSIKVLGVLGHGGAERHHVRASFLASAAGIVASFLALAGLAVAVKAAGAAVGWGIQFQQPGFLAAMVALLALFAANLWGAFEIPLPSWLLAGGNGKVPHHSVLGHFLSGAFATLLATPCSAPFLGTAVGFALARGPVEIFAIFAALGLGMALPFLAVAVWPGAATRLPKPGRWMLRVKQAMGLALGGTGLWLLTVLAVQAGIAAALLTGGAMAAAVAVLAVKPRMPERSQGAVPATVAALVALAVAAPFHLDEGGAGGRAEASAGIAWQAFERDAIPRLLAEGRTVFVDVTADWCITCKVNKAAVVERGEVARRLGLPGVVAMRADWTKPDDRIARFLADYGRYGIPFNIVYGPGAPEGVPLSELLTEAETLAALDRAGRPR